MTTYYVQRTLVQIIAVEAETMDEAIDIADDQNWETSIDTEQDYVVLDASGKVCS